MFKKAIVRRPGNSLVDGITTAGLGQPDFELALKQHDAYIAALESCGLAVTVMPAEEAYPDGMFVEDVALLKDQCAIVTRPGADARKGETESMALQLAEFFDQVHTVEAPGTADAGDIMMVADHFYIGLSERTNESGAEQIIAHLSQHGYTGSSIRISEGLHFKSSVSYLESNNIVVTGELCSKPELAQYNAIEIAPENAYSANSVWVNDRVLVPAGYAVTREKIKAAGYGIIELDVSEFRKLDGGLSCLSLRF